MSDLICVTNRTLCTEDYLTRIEEIAKQHPKGILLREKDLSPLAYTQLAEEVLAICKKHQTLCILHNFIEAARQTGCSAIHLPLPLLRNMTEQQKCSFSIIGSSCHSLQEAKEAELLGCTYITAGHIFETDCKKSLPGRGLPFLSEICKSISIPVYGIGGIHKENISAIRDTGAAGACIMSGIMQCSDVSAYLKNFEKNGEQNDIS